MKNSALRPKPLGLLEDHGQLREQAGDPELRQELITLRIARALEALVLCADAANLPRRGKPYASADDIFQEARMLIEPGHQT